MKTATVSLIATAAGLFIAANAISQTPNPNPNQNPSRFGGPPPPAVKMTVTPSGRVTAPPVAEMNEFQKQQYEGSMRMGGGPRMPLLNSLPILEAWNGMSVALTNSALPSKLRELAILVVGAHWKSEFEWHAHWQQAERAGVSAAAVEAIRTGKEPQLATEEERIVYRYAHELVVNHQVSDAAYNAAWKLLGSKTLVDLTVLLGHYTSVAMNLNAHKVPLPDGVKSPF